jgi:histidine ammonia-lyase
VPGQRHTVRRAHPGRCAGTPGQRDAAAIYRRLLAGSAIRASHADCPRVQDPYSLRCQPQVMGAVLDQTRSVAATLLDRSQRGFRQTRSCSRRRARCCRAATSHAEPVAFAADNLSLAIAETGALAERRVALLMDANLSGLPPFLVEDGGVNSGIHDRAGHRRRARLREQVARAPAQRRLAADVGEPGRPREHGDRRRRAARADGRQRRGRSSRVELLAARRASTFAAAGDVSAARGRHARLRAAAAFWSREPRAFAPDLAAVRAQVERGEFHRRRARGAHRRLTRIARQSARGEAGGPTMHRDDPKELAGKRADPRYATAPCAHRADITLACRSWLTEAAYRMIQNNLDPR